tara:strand:+ start:1809 stop:2279 length:471 start_codon:yes stop_codon:yes gene_type:complete
MDKDIDIKEIYKDAVNESTLFTETDIQNILDASNSVKNEYLEGQTTESIAELVNNSIKNLNLMDDVAFDYYYRLQNYRYIDGINDLHKGKHIRWIRNGKLTNGGILMNIKIKEDGILILCKNSLNKFMNYKWDNCVSYQKLSVEEQLILMANDNIL